MRGRRWLPAAVIGGLVLTLAAGLLAASATHTRGNMSELKYSHGRLSYRRKSTGRERGREDWSLTRNRDGTQTMRCLAMRVDS